MASEFEVGDIVWGKVESHPWWPGKICDEALASLSVRKRKFKGSLFVSFFGDNTYNWLGPKSLLPFESHFCSKSNQSNSKAFQEAVQEAINEVNLREELAFTCRCRNPSIGYEEGDVYHVGQVEKSRWEFEPAEMVSFLHKSALRPMNLPRDGHFLRNSARILAYRKILFAEKDPTYDEAFDSDDEDPKLASNDLRKAVAQGASSGDSQPIKTCSESKRAKVDNALEGPKVSKRYYGKASVIKNRYKFCPRNEGETEIVDAQALISEPSKPLTIPLKKSDTNIVGEPPLESSNMEEELALPKGAETNLLDHFENSQQTFPPPLPLPPVFRNVYSRKTLSQCGNAMNKKHLESCQTSDIARPIFKLLKEIDEHLEDLK